MSSIFDSETKLRKAEKDNLGMGSACSKDKFLKLKKMYPLGSTSFNNARYMDVYIVALCMRFSHDIVVFNTRTNECSPGIEEAFTSTELQNVQVVDVSSVTTLEDIAATQLYLDELVRNQKRLTALGIDLKDY